MAVASTAIFTVTPSGNDTTNPGLFDPGQIGNALTDVVISNANTGSPTITSATSPFSAADQNAYFFTITTTAGSATVQAGWWPIVSVNTNTGTATLNCAVGAGTLYPSLTLNTTAGISSTSTLSGSTAIRGCVDLSRNASGIALSGMTNSAAGTTANCTTAHKKYVGNGAIIAGGTNFVTGLRTITGASETISYTFDANVTTGVGSAGTGALGGALASPGQAGAYDVPGNTLFLKGPATYTITIASTNVAGGCVYWQGAQGGLNSQYITGAPIIGYNVIPGDAPLPLSGNQPTLSINSGVSNASVFQGYAYNTANIAINGNNQTGSKGLYPAQYGSGLWRECAILNLVIGVANNGGAPNLDRCYVSNCTTGAQSSGASYFNTEFAYCATPISGAAINCVINCLIYGHSTYGIYGFQNVCVIQNCTIANGSGVGLSQGGGYNGNFGTIIRNCVFWANAGGDINLSATSGTFIENCFVSTNVSYGNASIGLGMKTGTTSPFVNMASNNFDLNNTAGGGASCRGMGFQSYPSGNTTGYPDIGAAQSQATAGGGSPGIVLSSDRVGAI